MKRIFFTIILSVISTVMFAQTFRVINNTVYSVAYDNNGRAILTEAGTVDKIESAQKAWKFSGSISAGYSVGFEGRNTVPQISGLVSIGARHNNSVYLGVGSGIMNIKYEDNSNSSYHSYKKEYEYCVVPVFAEVNLNTNSVHNIDGFLNIKLGADLMVDSKYDGDAMFTVRVSTGIMFNKHVNFGVNYTFQASEMSKGHAVGVSLGYVF